ncbi:MAG: hypothetical protein Q4D57_00020 [Clostridia bacterium]|nr:hypothetical protein [Clostridia bacterium]
MKKLHLRLLASMLTITTILTSTPINSFNAISPRPVNSKRVNIPFGAKVAFLAGMAVVGVAGITGIACALSGDENDLNIDFGKMNGNLTNTASLCYWHAFVQQMYSLKSFRKFIKDVDLEPLQTVEAAESDYSNNPKTSEKIKAFRELFEEMDKGGRVDAANSLAFAKRILPGYVINDEQDIGEIFSQFINDVYVLYGQRLNVKKNNIFEDPIILKQEPLNLRSLLVGEPSRESQRNAVRGLVSNDTVREKYKEIIGKDIPEQVDDSVLNNIANDLSDVDCVKEALKSLKLPELDIPVIDDQFAIFVARHDYDIQSMESVKVTKRVDFGDGTVNYKGKIFEVTAVSVQKGNMDSGHYYTYKKHGCCWYKYDDVASHYSGVVSWNDVKKDAETGCTMLTFSLKK